jgi:acetate kinase
MTLVLTCNAGSSTLKLGLYQAGQKLAGTHWEHQPEGAQGEAALAAKVVTWLATVAPPQDHLAAIAHRVVHGGDHFDQPVWVDADVLQSLWELADLAPLHQPPALKLLQALQTTYPTVPQLACFDTAFHAKQPEVARRLGLPEAMHQAGIKRYGFHGLSYDYIASQLPSYLEESARKRVVVAHLGSGASLCALANGQSIASTMGFSALDGLLMATRCGAMDAGVLLHLLTKGYDAAQLSDLLYKQSGLLGVSGGISGDMRVLLNDPSPQAAAAVDLFIYRAHQQLAAMVASLGGIDALIFTAGIGEHSAAVRQRLCSQAAWLGMILNPAQNAANATNPTAPNSLVQIRVIPTDEEAVMAKACLNAIKKITII